MKARYEPARLAEAYSSVTTPATKEEVKEE
jgi:hypothetical protein